MHRIAPSHNYKPVAKLGCLNCQHRKRKCDKSCPFAACQQAGLVCTPVMRARLPRGRHAVQRDSDLQQRVSRLEELLLLSQGDQEPVINCTHPDLPTSSSMSKEVMGIRELLDSSIEDETEQDQSRNNVLLASSTQSRNDVPLVLGTQSFDVLMDRDASCLLSHMCSKSPTREIVSELLDVYLYRVDPIFKVCHVPTLKEMILKDGHLTLTQETLKFAILFAAMNSLGEQERLNFPSSSLDKIASLSRFQQVHPPFLSLNLRKSLRIWGL
jgi:hypothetical protein